MRKIQSMSIVLIAGWFGLASGFVLAQTAQKSGSGIVCWKDKAGKTIGCGDKVPPEYQDNANKVLNKSGLTVKQTDPQPTPEQKAAALTEAEQKKIESQKREEERRRDRALLDSFTNEKEIDLKRTRDIQQIEINISAQQGNLKNVTDRQLETKAKFEAFKKENKPVPIPIQDDAERLEVEKSRIQAQILQKRKEIVERNQEYDAMKKRFMELKGITPAPAAPVAVTPVPAATTAKK